MGERVVESGVRGGPPAGWAAGTERVDRNTKRRGVRPDRAAGDAGETLAVRGAPPGHTLSDRNL